jgi:hypothetical protein
MISATESTRVAPTPSARPTLLVDASTGHVVAVTAPHEHG